MAKTAVKPASLDDLVIGHINTTFPELNYSTCSSQNYLEGYTPLPALPCLMKKHHGSLCHDYGINTEDTRLLKQSAYAKIFPEGIVFAFAQRGCYGCSEDVIYLGPKAAVEAAMKEVKATRQQIINEHKPDKKSK